MGKDVRELLSGMNKAKDTPAAHDEKLEAECPLLHSLLTQTSLGNGRFRKPCTLSIFAADGVWKASLNARDEGLVLLAAADVMAALPEALETLLNLDVIPWRRSAMARGGKFS